MQGRRTSSGDDGFPPATEHVAHWPEARWHVPLESPKGPAVGKELIDRAALERIIRRAAELQAAQREIGEGLTEDDVLELGREVGIPVPYLQQAIVEARTGGVQLDPERGLAGWLAGADAVAAERVVPGATDVVVDRLDTWMRAEEGMSTMRRSQGHLRWERTRGFVAEMRRSFAVGGRPYILARTDDVTADVTGLEEGYSYVRLVATVRRARNQRVAGAATLTSFGVVAAAAVAVLGFFPLAAVVPAAAGLALSVPVLRRHQRTTTRTQIALEQVLDRLEAGEIRAEHRLPRSSTGAHLIERVSDELRKAWQPSRRTRQ